MRMFWKIFAIILIHSVTNDVWILNLFVSVCDQFLSQNIFHINVKVLLEKFISENEQIWLKSKLTASKFIKWDVFTLQELVKNEKYVN